MSTVLRPPATAAPSRPAHRTAAVPAVAPSDFSAYVRAAGLVVQPRMGMGDPALMAAGLRAVVNAGVRTVGTMTLDSYTRVGDHESARAALAGRGTGGLNGFPLVVHGPRTTALVAAAAGTVPVQVRHGSAQPQDIFRTLVEAGLSASEGGPVSYCLPYGRVPLRESVAHWRESTRMLAQECADRGRTAHLETFGGCLLGQLCPPSLLVAMSVLEGMFFVQNGIRSVSLSYAQQTDSVQDVEALAALDLLSREVLPPDVDRHRVLYTYMGVFPGTEAGAGLLLERSAEIAVRAGVERLIVKTVAEGRRLPTVAENVAALRAAATVAARGSAGGGTPGAGEVDCGGILDEARTLVHAVLGLHDDIGKALTLAFSAGVLDVPFCLHQDNRGLTQGAIDTGGRLVWARTGKLPLAPGHGRAVHPKVNSAQLITMLWQTAGQHDKEAAALLPAGREAGLPPAPQHAPAAFTLRLSRPAPAGNRDDGTETAVPDGLTGALDRLGLRTTDARSATDPVTGRFLHRAELRPAADGPDLPQVRDHLARVLPPDAEWELRDAAAPHPVLVLAGRGPGLRGLLRRVHDRTIPVEVRMVVSSYPEALAEARRGGVPFHGVPEGETEEALRDALRVHGARTLVLVDQPAPVSAGLCRDMAGRIIGVHPGALPAFQGPRPHEQAHAQGVKVIGATAYYVTARPGEGPIIEQDFARVRHTDTPARLADISAELQLSSLATALTWHAQQRIFTAEGRTVVFS